MPSARIYVEDHNRQPANYNPGADDLWSRASTFPMIRMDMRYQVASNGQVFWNPSMTALQVAQSVKNRVKWFFDNVGAQWPVDKPKEYAIVWVGGVDGSANLWITNHPDDKFVGGSAVQNAIYPVQGVSISRQRIESIMPLVRAELDTLPYPLPIVHFMNQETLADQGVLGSTVGGDSLLDFLIADSRYATTKIDGRRTAKEILEESAKTLANQPIPAPDPSWTLPSNGRDYYISPAPQNHDRTSWLTNIINASFKRAIEQIWVEPIRASFPDAIIGEWQFVRTSRLHPVRAFSPAPYYQGDGYFGGMDLSIPVDYSAPHLVNDGYSVYNHPWSPASGDWGNAFGLTKGADSTALFYAKCGREAVKWNVDQLLRVGGGHKVAPSIAIGDTYSSADAAAIRDELVKAMAWCSNAGAHSFWLFEPDYWDYQALGNTARKTAINALVDEYEASSNSNTPVSGPAAPSLSFSFTPATAQPPVQGTMALDLSSIDNQLSISDFYVSVDLSPLGVSKTVSLAKVSGQNRFEGVVDVSVTAPLGTSPLTGALVYMGSKRSVAPSTAISVNVSVVSSDGGENQSSSPPGTSLAPTIRVRLYVDIEDLYGGTNTFGVSVGLIPGRPDRP